MPHTGTLAIVAASAMAGVPLLNGFLSKEMFFAEALELRHLGLLGGLAPAAVTLGGAFSVAYSARFVHDVFFNGEPRDLPRAPHEAPRFMKVPVEVLVAVVRRGRPLARADRRAAGRPRRARGVRRRPAARTRSRSGTGSPPPLLLSALAFAGGAILYWALQRQYNLHLHVPSRWSARRLVPRPPRAASRASRARLTAGLDNGSLSALSRRCCSWSAWLWSPAALLARRRVAIGDARHSCRSPPLGVVAGLVLVAAALGCVIWHRQRLVALVFSSVVGLVVSLAFLYFSAPDLATDPARRRGGHDRADADGARAVAADRARGESSLLRARARCDPRRARRRRRGRVRAGGHDARSSRRSPGTSSSTACRAAAGRTS